MFNLTKRSMNHLLNFFTQEDPEEGLKDFLKSEYKKDWYAAYQTYKEEKRFPQFVRRTL